MSKFSGYADVYDWFDGATDEEIKRSTFYYNDIMITINSRRDLVPYYGCAVGVGMRNNVEEKSVIYMYSDESQFKYATSRANLFKEMMKYKYPNYEIINWIYQKNKNENRY